MLNVKTGQFHPYLENAFLKDVKALKKDNPLNPLLIITPSRRILERLQELLVTENKIGLVNVDFHTFFSLALALYSDSGLSEKPVITDSLFSEEMISRKLQNMPLPIDVDRGDVRTYILPTIQACYSGRLEDVPVMA